MMKTLLKERVIKSATQIKAIMPQNLTLVIASLVGATAVWAWVTKNVVGS